MKPIFRNSMFGFHKEDVFQFITKQNKQFESRVREMNEEKDRIEKVSSEELASLQRQLDEANEINARWSRQSENMDEVKEGIFSLFSEFENVLSCAESCRVFLNNMKSSYASMQSEVSRAQALREKAEKFDRLSGVLTSILVGTKSSDATDDVPSQIDEEFALQSIDDSSFVNLFAKLKEVNEQLTVLMQNMDVSGDE